MTKNSARSPEREAYQQALMKLIGGRPVAYWPHLARLVGGVKAAVMLSQLLYWNGDSTVIKRDGWVLKSVEDMENETGLTKVEQQTARTILKQFELVESKLKGSPRIWHYRVNTDNLSEILIGKESHSMRKSFNEKVIQSESHSMTNLPDIGRESDPTLGDFPSQLKRNIKTTSSKTTSSKTTSSSSSDTEHDPEGKEEEVSKKSYENLSAEFVEECLAIGVFEKLLPEVARAVAAGITEETLMDLMDDVEKKEPNAPRTGALFMWRLRHAPPGKQLTKDDRDAIKRKSYITGEFADFIQH